jgi:hypothetical protein
MNLQYCNYQEQQITEPSVTIKVEQYNTSPYDKFILNSCETKV